MHKIKTQSPFFFDGAFGTYYHKISGRSDACELANLSDRDTVHRIHREYINAGVNAIKTNTFGANSLFDNDFSVIEKIIQSGYAIAMDAVKGTDVEVFADIGYIHSPDEDASDEYIRIADIFIGLGAKNFLFETFAEFDVLLPVLEHIKQTADDAAVIVSFAVSQDGYTKTGLYYKDLFGQAVASGRVAVAGFNCICGPSHLCSLIKELDIKDAVCCAMPNSGYPALINGRTVYQDNTEYFSNKMTDIFALGASVLGGCCGTTPGHIKAVVQKLKGTHVAPPHNEVSAKRADGTIIKNSFYNALSFGEKVIAVELDTPIDTQADYLISAARAAGSAGADIITLADSPLARTRADSFMMGAKIKRETGIEVMPHLTCRDKNHIGIKSALMGASIENINTVLAITGDPVAQTDRGEYKGVYSFNSFKLISFIKSLNADIFADAPFCIGGALNVNATRFEVELARARQKLNSGAAFLLTQPLFSEQAVQNLRLAREQLDCKLLAGILPVASYKNALFLSNEVSGIDIPDDLIEKMKDKDANEVMEISTRFSMEMIKKAYHLCDGFYLITPMKKIDFVCRLIEGIRSINK